jgi:hypothetical protein
MATVNDGMTFVCEEEMSEKVGIIIRQTNYTTEIAREKLLMANMDYIKVIKEYCGITEKKAPPVKSLQQQIYKEIRYRLDDSIRDFNNKQDKKLASEIENNKK